MEETIGKVLYILPHQLFDPEDLRPVLQRLKKPRVVLWEHRDFFTKFRFNKKKLVLHRASMRYSHDKVLLPLLSEFKKGHCEYVEVRRKGHRVPKGAVCFDPINRVYALKGARTIETPNFLLTKDQYSALMKKNGHFKTKNLNFTRHFYAFCKQQLKYMQDVPSQDRENRGAMKDGVAVPPLPSPADRSERKYVEEAVAYVNRHFPKNYGTTEGFAYPVSRARALVWLDDFMKKRLNGFGTYQDAIRDDDAHNVMFHSVLSSSINIGLLHPLEVKRSLERHASGAGLNDVEGFFRQLCWREYQRFCYVHFFDELKTNFYGSQKKLTKAWYDGTIGMRPVDVCVQKAFDTAYLHHIERLMVVGNFMVLSEIRPTDAHRWFMEFAIDSYEWVMLQNVYDMLYFGSGGRTAYKPYISSSSYVLKMSNYRRSEDWVPRWSQMYKDFILKHKERLHKYRYHFPYI